MKNFTRSICAFFVFAMTLLTHPVQASHLKGGDTYFECVGTGGQYVLVFSCYYACEPTSITPDPDPADFSWTLTSSCGTVPASITAATATTAMDVPLYCAGVRTQCDYNPYSSAPPGTPIGTLVITYTSAPFTIPPGCTVTADMYFTARNAAISNLTNPSSHGINIETTITAPLSGSCQYNPLFAAYPVDVFCVNQNANFSQGAVDLGGDSLTYTLINPQDGGGIPIPFVPGCTPGNPLGVGNGTGFASYFKFDSTTGNINFTPTATGDYVLAIQVNAYSNGVLVGTTMRDIQFSVILCANNNDPPVLKGAFTTSDVIGATVIDSNHIGVCPGEQVTINFTIIEPDSFSFVRDSSNVQQSLPGSTISITQTGGVFDTAHITIVWTPGGSDSGFHYFLLQVSDTTCPLPGRNTYAFVVSVLKGVYAGPNQVYCDGGQPVTIFASGANHYLWTDSATGGPPVGVISYGPDSSYIVVAPSSIPLGTSVGYVVKGDLLGSCKNRDTVSVKNAPLFALTASAAQASICKFTATTLSTTTNPNSVGPFTYQWSPASSVIAPTAGTTATTGLLNTTEFYVTATAIGGCAIRDSVNVSINGAAPQIFITPSNNYVCHGDTVTLNTQVFAENLVTCGTVDTCVNNNLLYEIPVNNDTSSTTGGTTGTAVYCSPFMGSYNSYKAQYLFTKQELNAAGLSSGSFTDLSFFVKQVNSTAGYDTFSVSMGCTNLDSLTGFVNNLVEVVPPQYGFNAVYPNQGWTPLPFTHFYNWDGASNIIVQVCYTISSSISSQDDYVSFSTTSYNGSSYIAGDNFTTGFNGCDLGPGSDLGPEALNSRPNIKFGMCAPNILKYQWSPATLLCDTCPVTQVIVNSNKTYELVVTAGSCANDTTVTVFLNPHIGSVALTDTTLCAGDTVQLGVALTNAPVSQCQLGYTVTSIPYSAVSGSPTAVQPVQYVDAFGNQYATDNGTAGPFAVGFSFPFFCQDYSQFYINSNGWITFQFPYPATAGYQEYTAQTLPPGPGDLNPQKVIELMMGDYDLSDGFGLGGGSTAYFVTGSPPNRELVVQFINMQDESGSYTTSGEMHLHETSGIIDILISSSDYFGTNHTTGVKDSIGYGTAAPVMNNQQYTVATPVAWRFTPEFGPSVAVNSSIWSPNNFLSNDSITNPLAYPTTSQTYYVTSELVINQFTHPSLCAVYDTVTVRVDSFQYQYSLSVSPATICPGDTSQITFSTDGNPVSTYTWTPAFGLSSATIASPGASVFDTTTYHILAVDNHGCSIKDSVKIAVLPTPALVLTPDSVVCYSDSLLLQFSGSYSNYQWYRIDSATGARVLVSSGPGNTSVYAHPQSGYILEVTPTGGSSCNYFTNIVYVDSFIRPPLLVIDSFGPINICIGQHAVLETEQGFTDIQWTPASYGSQTSFPVTTPGTFSYTARDPNGCLEYSNTVSVTVNPLPVFTVTATANPICVGLIDTLVASTTPPATTITWTGQPAGNTLITSAPGTYQLTADLDGCVNDTSFVLLGADTPMVHIPLAIIGCGCPSDTVITAIPSGGTPPYTYVWSNTGTGPTTTDSIIGISTYSVVVTDANHCTAISNTLASTINCPNVNISIAPATDTIFESDTAVLTATPVISGSNYAFVWSNSNTTSVLAPTASITGVIGDSLGVDTVYLLVTDNATQCTYPTYAIIHVIEFGAFAMPTAFTPNGDGKNDVFYPQFNGPNSPAHATAFRIYDRWGQMVYDNPNAPGWDGNYGGKAQPSEAYMYFITVEYPDPADPTKTKSKSVEGSVMLFR
jgi:gliding motility-associated-like protein